jgi:surfactin synthase thioesterase subunit
LAGSTGSSAAWVRRFHPSAAPVARLVCFPHAGGSASYFFPLSQAMAPSIEVLALQYPGRQDRRAEEPLTSIRDFAAHAFEALRPWADLPLVFFGHSMGATIAFEVARLFDEADTCLQGLFVSGRRAPTTYRDERVHLLPDDGIVAEIMKLDGTDSALLDDVEILRMILPAVKNDYRAIETYAYQPSRALRCPIMAMVGDDDPRATLDEVRAWREHTSGPFELEVFTGGHFYLAGHQTEIVNTISDHVLVACGAAPGPPEN